MGSTSPALIPLIKCQGKIALHSIGPLPCEHPHRPGLSAQPAKPSLSRHSPANGFSPDHHHFLSACCLSLVPHPVAGQSVLSACGLQLRSESLWLFVQTLPHSFPAASQRASGGVVLVSLWVCQFNLEVSEILQCIAAPFSIRGNCAA